MCIININRTDKLIRIQHEKKHGKGSPILTTKWSKKKKWKNKLMMVLSMNDECAYAYVKDDDDLCA